MSINQSHPGRRRTVPFALPLATALLLSACVQSTSDGASAGGPGVEHGASKEAYVDALAGAGQVTLTMQTAGSPGHYTSRATEQYAETVEEWSGGTVEIEIAYGDAVAPATEIPDALADGRLDLGLVLPLYDPSRYPVNNALADISFLGTHSPVVGTLETTAGFLEAAFDTPELTEELEGEGIMPLLPYAPTDSVGMACTEPRTGADELHGSQVRVSGSVHGEQTEALGMTPVSLSYEEMYEALQRGTIDCAAAALWVGEFAGFLPVAPEFTVGSEAALSRIPYSLGIGMSTWEDLPLAAQQLLHDRLDVFIEGMLRHGIWEGITEALEAVDENGGSVRGYGAQAREELHAVNETILDDVRATDALADGETFVRDTRESVRHWHDVVTGELGYADEGGYGDFAEWYSPAEIDLTPFLDRLDSDVLREQRPD
ncbi:C4-dicarboxylate ABC transporter substrate-binding protein [Haloechinothrix sp. YIM 98757]|uniref:C4-dicarboxylate ABC transporter substrate-binding protein n=1 Tax=Haloechinothrix aidingensis TaxID=2752311 RepID=A0A838ABE1_9PSEU|nr:C4-dicarboxylate ABC transporter substrate-binding protein [Haloechinothrix aidingensis]MBA0126572.1 C4-dicarboxylate ABC transporter substrate-binding protein [Haloechinothrix aidingensis]